MARQPWSNYLGPNDENRAEKAVTHPGMAHFGRTGPTNTTCRECRHWNWDSAEALLLAPYDGYGKLKPQTCQKFLDLMTFATGPAVPHSARSCKYFSRSPNPPETTKSAQDAKNKSRAISGC